VSTAVRRAAPPKITAAKRPRLRAVTPKPRRRSALVYWVFAASLIGLLILGLVSLNALLAQQSFRIAELTDRVDRLSEIHDDHVLEVAQLSTPSRILDGAALLGMEIPKRTVVLRIPGPRAAHRAVGERP
jgi:cell division protein FtsL